MKRLLGKLTYSNVVATACLFLVLGGGTAFAASHLGKNSVGEKQLRRNAVTAAKVKAGAVTGAKLANGAVSGSKLAPGAVSGADIAPGAVSGDKLAPGAVTGDKINVGSLPTVPNSATTNVVKGSHGTLHIGQEAPIFSYGPFTITAQCKEVERAQLAIGSPQLYEHFLISSSTPHSVFASWWDGGDDLGPQTPAEERVIGETRLNLNEDSFQYEGPSEVNVSASATNGQAFNAFIGEAADRDSGTCWYWLSANVIG